MMQRKLLIVDFTYLYHRNIYMYRSGRMKPIYAAGKRDITMSYLICKQIETVVAGLRAAETKVDVLICMDSKSTKQGENGYKETRVSKLTSDDYSCIAETAQLLAEAGHTVVQQEGMEADDLIASAVVKYKAQYDSIVIMTVDRDLLQLVDGNVSVRLQKQVSVIWLDESNLTQFMLHSYKAPIPAGAYLIYKAFVGDTSDNIKGITKFGNKAWEKLLQSVYEAEILPEMSVGIDEIKAEKFIHACKEFMLLTDKQIDEARTALKLAAFKLCVEQIPEIQSAQRAQAFTTYMDASMPTVAEICGEY